MCWGRFAWHAGIGPHHPPWTQQLAAADRINQKEDEQSEIRNHHFNYHHANPTIPLALTSAYSSVILHFFSIT